MNARASAAALQPSLAMTIADVVRLSKPRITLLVIVTGLGGMWLATRLAGASIGLGRALAALAGISLIVSAANALNMVIERDTDALMERTRDRPLPAGRLTPAAGTWFGVALAALALPLLALAVNALTAALALAAFALYVGVYTPLKRVAPVALLVGAVPGAAPPLLGWTAATGEIGAAGVALFAVLFFWQVPHFLAIATFRCDEYTRAGIRVLPAVAGERAARWHATAHAALLLVSSLALVPLGVSGPVYLINALSLGVLFVWATARGLKSDALSGQAAVRWSRSVFVMSLLYLPLLIAAMMVSA